MSTPSSPPAGATVSAGAGTPHGIDALFALPEGAMVPVGWVRGLIEEAARRRTTEAAIREETIQMWCEIVTRNLCVGDSPQRRENRIP